MRKQEQSNYRSSKEIGLSIDTEDVKKELMMTQKKINHKKQHILLDIV